MINFYLLNTTKEVFSFVVFSNERIMRKIIILLFFVTTGLSAQNITIEGDDSFAYVPFEFTNLGKNIIQCQFKQTIVNDTLNPKEKTERIMLLQLGNNVSSYTDYNEFLYDSLYTALGPKETSMSSLLMKLSPYKKGTEKLRIYKNYPVGKITSTYNILGDYYISEEVLSPQNWTVSNQYDKILGYNCRKATTSFRGRDYTAWFSTDIPINVGPWKFSGLPGLILKVADSKNEVSMECISLVRINWNSDIYLKKHLYQKTNNKQLNDLIKRYKENPKSFIQNNPNLQLSSQQKTTKSVKRPYNSIELSD